MQRSSRERRQRARARARGRVALSSEARAHETRRVLLHRGGANKRAFLALMAQFGCAALVFLLLLGDAFARPAREVSGAGYRRDMKTKWLQSEKRDGVDGGGSEAAALEADGVVSVDEARSLQRSMQRLSFVQSKLWNVDSAATTNVVNRHRDQSATASPPTPNATAAAVLFEGDS